jgi:hypothetical protein
MKVKVERCAGHLGVEMPVRFRLAAREVEIVETVDQWYGPDYPLLQDQRQRGRAEWELSRARVSIRRTSILKAEGCRCK